MSDRADVLTTWLIEEYGDAEISTYLDSFENEPHAPHDLLRYALVTEADMAGKFLYTADTYARLHDVAINRLADNDEWPRYLLDLDTGQSWCAGITMYPSEGEVTA